MSLLGVRPPRRFRILLSSVALLSIVIILAVGLVRSVYRYAANIHDVGARPVRFVDDRACAKCHQAQYRQWSGSHHALAMQPANDRTVLGDFNNVVFADRGMTARFYRRSGQFFVRTEGPDGRVADFEITYTIGVDPLQQYLTPFPGGRLQSLSIAWDTHRGRWFSLRPNQKIALDDPLRWTGRYNTWNLMCAECHTTNLRKGYDLESDSYHTVEDGLNVGCQACHGPGQTHVEWASGRRAGRGRAPADTALLVDFKHGDSRAQVDNCARCHSRRVRLSAEEAPGHPLLDEFRPELLRPDLYHADGQQFGEVYEYGSFRQSAMYQRGVRCTDCHESHSAKLLAEGPALCTRCHSEKPDPRFPTLKSQTYDSPGHHFHHAGSPGAVCVNCHMPARTYMIVHARRDHSFRIPRPDLSTILGTPNACNDCHKDKSPQWATRVLRRWYGRATVLSVHYAETIAAGRRGAHVSEPSLIALTKDRAQAAIVRATALELLHGDGPAGVAAIVAATRDEDPVVRVAAASALDRFPVQMRSDAAGPLLKDPIRAVRLEAARVLAGIPSQRLDSSQRHQLDAALAELTTSQRAMADVPSSHGVLGALQERLGQRDLAERSYLTALRMDRQFVPARTSLASLYNRMGRTAEAERTLRDGLSLAPMNGELHYALALVLAEHNRLGEAVDELGAAARLLSDRPRVHYNYGLALQHMGHRRAAESTLLRAHRLDESDREILYALAVLYLQDQNFARARVYVKRLGELAPADAAARELFERLQEVISRKQKSKAKAAGLAGFAKWDAEGEIRECCPRGPSDPKFVLAAVADAVSGVTGADRQKRKASPAAQDGIRSFLR